MNKLMIFGLVFLLMIVGVSAYDINDTLTINAEYRVDGVLTAGDAYINIYDPDTDIIINNVEMNDTAVGRFYYNYTLPSTEGKYTAVVRFFVGGVFVGDDTQSFIVGDENKVKFGITPTGTTGIIILFAFMLIIIVLAIAGMVLKNVGLTFFSSIILFFMATITWGFGEIIGIITIVLAVIFLIISGAMK